MEIFRRTSKIFSTCRAFSSFNANFSDKGGRNGLTWNSLDRIGVENVRKQSFILPAAFNRVSNFEAVEKPFWRWPGFLSSSLSTLIRQQTSSLHTAQLALTSHLWKMHMKGPRPKAPKRNHPFLIGRGQEGPPFKKGVVLRTLTKKPKKPNSGNRKCVQVRLSTGKVKYAFVPGIGHNLNENNIVLCKVHRLPDVPGMRIRCVRGKYDLPHVRKE